jgi:hypothetical protein
LNILQPGCAEQKDFSGQCQDLEDGVAEKGSGLSHQTESIQNPVDDLIIERMLWGIESECIEKVASKKTVSSLHIVAAPQKSVYRRNKSMKIHSLEAVDSFSNRRRVFEQTHQTFRDNCTTIR